MSTLLEYILLLMAPATPLLLAMGLILPLWRTVLIRMMPIAAVPALLAALLLTANQELELPWLLLGAHLGIDDTSRIFLLFSSVLWLAACMSLPESGRLRFCSWLLITMFGNFSVLLAQDIPTFFLAYAAMSLATFGLVIHWQTKTSVYAAKVYLVFAVLGEMILLTAMVLVAHNADSIYLEHVIDRDPEHLLMTLLFIGFGIKAGVPLFKSFVSLSQGGYGALSEEFRQMVKTVQTGGNVEDELDRIAMHNPSLYLRRAIWQISNGVKAGSDMSAVLNSIIDNISKEQALAMRRYGSQLNPLTLVYMMVAVIIPALGITMLIVLSSFSGMTITETMLWGILGALAFLQFMYIGLIKSKRPNM